MILDDAKFSLPATESVLIQSPSDGQPAGVQGRGARLVRTLAALPDVANMG